MINNLGSIITLIEIAVAFTTFNIRLIIFWKKNKEEQKKNQTKEERNGANHVMEHSGWL